MTSSWPEEPGYHWVTHNDNTVNHLAKAVQALDGPGRIGLAHLDEPESAGAAGLTIGRQRHGLDSPVR